MSKAALLCALAALACHGSNPGSADPAAPEPGEFSAAGAAVLNACSPYSESSNAHGYCIFQQVRRVVRPLEAASLCAWAGDWASECSQSWTNLYMPEEKGLTRDTLLMVCGEADDCALQVLDARAESDTETQVRLCELHAGRFARDCVGHAMERWWTGEPDGQSVARVASIRSPYADRIAYFVSASVACRGIGTCQGSDEIRRWCENSVEGFKAHPEKCPRPRPDRPGPNRR